MARKAKFQTNMNLPKVIREMQRENEKELLAWLRKAIKDGYPVSSMTLFNNAFRAAMERLEAAGKVVYFKPRGSHGLGYYKPVPNARPVTNVN